MPQFGPPPLFQTIIQYVQLAISLLFPILLLALLYLAWRDFRRLVDFRTRQSSGVNEKEVKEFIE